MHPLAVLHSWQVIYIIVAAVSYKVSIMRIEGGGSGAWLTLHAPLALADFLLCCHSVLASPAPPHESRLRYCSGVSPRDRCRIYGGYYASLVGLARCHRLTPRQDSAASPSTRHDR
jgi:hypothetical protein